MKTTQLQGPYCQSCAMPLDFLSISKRDNRYCIYCQDQETGKLVSFYDVREESVRAAMNFMGKTKEEAEDLADSVLPTLPRWQKELKR